MSHRLCIAVLFVSSIARLVSVFGMLLQIRVFIAADGIIASAAVHAGGRPHQSCVEQLHRCVVHIAQGRHDVCKAVPDGKFLSLIHISRGDTDGLEASGPLDAVASAR